MNGLRFLIRAIRLPSVASFAWKSSSQQHKRIAIASSAGLCLGLGLYRWTRQSRRDSAIVAAAECKEPALAERVQAGHVIEGLPDYTLEEVRKHSTLWEGRVWVTYKYGVYDITDFLALHPGGPDKISLAAGASIEPYWAVFANHNTDEVREILEGLRIGNIAPGDREKVAKEVPAKDSPYANDPVRSPVLKVNTHQPFNAETPSVLLAEHYLTPNDIFFVRNHLPVPQVDADTYTLEIKGEGMEQPLRLTLEDLKTKFSKHKVTSTIQCAGNRRVELNRIKTVKGIPWTGGAIGTAEWGGARLRDVLLHAGVKEEDIEHVHLEGLDNNPLTGERYGGSIPAHKAMSLTGDCLLAYEMNGVDIPRDHGYPVRAIVPGVVGARNIKWLATIVASKEEYGGFWQQNDYKGFAPSVNWDNVDFSSAPAIQELPVTSFICAPKNGTHLAKEDTDILVQGIAWSGGGREVVRVDVSSDGGKTWHVADIVAGRDQKYMRAWAWVLWEAHVPIPEGCSGGEVELCCKAVDMSYNVQPDTTAPIWNLRGCLSNAWHRINVKLPNEH